MMSVSHVEYEQKYTHPSSVFDNGACKFFSIFAE